VSKQRGFTLIEMLVSMAIMTAVVSLASYSYRFYINLSHKNDKKYELLLNETQVWQRVRERVSESIDYYIKPKYRTTVQDIPLFLGREKELYGVSERGLFDSERLVLYWIGVIDSKLLYCEKPIVGFIPTEDTIEPDICETSVLIRDNINAAEFRYFGWRGLSDKLSSSNLELVPDVSQLKGWYSRYEGRERLMLPSWIEISIKQSDASYSEKTRFLLPILNQDPDRLTYYLGSSNEEG